MTSRVESKWDSHDDTGLQAPKSPGAGFNFMGLCTEIRLMIYKEAFSEFCLSGPPQGLEGSLNAKGDSKTASGSDDPGETAFSGDWHKSGTSDDLWGSGDQCDSGDTPGALDDCNGLTDRARLKDKLGLALASKAICREALPVLYEVHHFKLTIWEEIQDSVEARKPAEDIFTYQYYFVRRNPMLAEHMTHVEISFDLNYDCSDTLYAGGHLLTISLLQDIASACPKLETLRFLTAIFPHGWVPNDDPRSILRRDTAVACFRTFAQQGCSLEFQLDLDTGALTGFLEEIAALSLGIWTDEHPRDLRCQLKNTEAELLRIWGGYPQSDLHRLSASSSLRIQKGLSAEDRAKERSSTTTNQESA